MSSLITRVRQSANADTNEYSLAGTTYWLDDHLQEYLDRHQRVIIRELLRGQTRNVNGDIQIFDFTWACPDVEEYDPSDVNIWRLEDSNGSVVGTANYTVNYHSRTITFTTDQLGNAYFLSYRAYNYPLAVADVWAAKAANVANRYDVQTGDQRMSRSQMVRQFEGQARMWRGQAQPTMGNFVRSDM